MNNIEINNNIFESIKHIHEFGNEYLLARELSKILEYSEYRKFLSAIKKAMISCKNSNQNIDDHFGQVAVMVGIGSNAKRKLNDYKLTRYACYLITQNGDSRKSVIALAQTYFAIQIRKQELSEKAYDLLTEDEKRFYQRDLTRKGNYSLNQTALMAGVRDFPKFHNAGYRGLYNGEQLMILPKEKG